MTSRILVSMRERGAHACSGQSGTGSIEPGLPARAIPGDRIVDSERTCTGNSDTRAPYRPTRATGKSMGSGNRTARFAHGLT
jgi:hypothetical protein